MEEIEHLHPDPPRESAPTDPPGRFVPAQDADLDAAFEPAWDAEPAPAVPVPPADPPAPAPDARTFAQAAAAELARDLSRLLSDDLRVHPMHRREQSYGEFARGLAERTSCYALAAPADGPASERMWIELDPAIAFALVSRLLGSAEAERVVPQRPLTLLERRLLGRTVQAAAHTLARLLHLEPPACPCWSGGLWAPAPPDREDEPVSVFRFALELRRRSGAMRIAVASSLLAGAWKAAAGPEGGEPPRRSIAPLELVVDVEGGPMGPEEARALAEGDLLVTDANADGEVIVRVAGIPKFAARLGHANGRRAIRITRRIDGGES